MPWTLILVLCSATMAAAAPAPERVLWDFEGEQTGWTPRASSITLARAEGGFRPESKSSLLIRGAMASGWNYVASSRHPLTPGHLYRLTAWLRVERLSPGSPAPYLKCEFIPTEAGKTPTKVGTTGYDLKRLKTWQRLEAEFQAPEGADQFWLALEKGTSNPTEIEAALDDVLVERIERLSIYDRYRMDPLPAPLQERRGQHPRLYLDAGRVTALKAAINTTHAALWPEVREQADRSVASGPPAYRKDDGWSGNEQLWQRSVGNAMPPLALAWLLTGERKYLDSARAWALASCAYPTWGLGSADGMDLAAGHQLFGLAIVYDWCYHDLDEATRRTIRETLTRRTDAMFRAVVTNRAWWGRAYLQNHLWVNISGMAAAGLALYDEVEDAPLWIALPLEKFQRTMESLGPDGASHEGAPYWQYGVEYMLKFMHLSRELLNVDLYGRDWWRNTAAYALYLTIPRNAWTRTSSVVDLADSPRGNWYGPDYLLRALAREYRDGHAQWLAAQVDEANIDSAGARWLNLIWYDPSVAPVPPTNLPTLRHFNDMEIVSARSGWSGDDSLVVFKSGPFIGHHAMKTFSYDPGGGHVHPDANHFALFGNGEWLIRDDGYRPKFTAQHNTLTIDGKGQLGEGDQWFSGAAALTAKASARVTRAASTPGLDHIVGDATEAYPRDTGLRRYTRHLLFLKPDVLLVVDDISLDQARTLDLRFHPEKQAAREQDGAFLARGEKAVLRLESLTPEGVAITAGDAQAKPREGHKSDAMFAIRLQANRAQWRNAVALSWCATGAQPVPVRLRATGDRWEFTAGNRVVVLDWKTGQATLAR